MMSEKNDFELTDSEYGSLKNLTEAEKNELVVELRRLMSENENLMKLKSDDAYLLRFLYSCNFKVDVAYNKMVKFYDLLLKYPEWFTTTSPTDLKFILEKNIRYVLPVEDKRGRPIYVVKLGNLCADNMDLYDVVGVDCVWMEYLLSSTSLKAVKNGISVIIDVKNCPWKLVKWLTPHIVKTAVRRFETFPLRSVEFHVVNSTFILNMGINLIWPFLSGRLRDMVKFHFDDFAALHEYIDPDVLPPEYGGEKDYNAFEGYQILYDNNDKIVKNLMKYHVVKVEPN